LLLPAAEVWVDFEAVACELVEAEAALGGWAEGLLSWADESVAATIAVQAIAKSLVAPKSSQRKNDLANQSWH
jgi:hypothetical protein